MKMKILILAPFALFFLLFGIVMLAGAYQQNNPAIFLALFFSSSFIVLLSLTCLIAVFYHLMRPEKGVLDPGGPPESATNETCNDEAPMNEKRSG